MPQKRTPSKPRKGNKGGLLAHGRANLKLQSGLGVLALLLLPLESDAQSNPVTYQFLAQSPAPQPQLAPTTPQRCGCKAPVLAWPAPRTGHLSGARAGGWDAPPLDDGCSNAWAEGCFGPDGLCLTTSCRTKHGGSCKLGARSQLRFAPAVVHHMGRRHPTTAGESRLQVWPCRQSCDIAHTKHAQDKQASVHPTLRWELKWWRRMSPHSGGAV